MAVKIITGPAIVGFVYANFAEAVQEAVPVLVHHYAKATGLDVHPAEAQVVEVREIDRGTGRRAATATTEVRIGGTAIASWRGDGQPAGAVEIRARLIRCRDAVYDSREAALADGFADAEYGTWIPSHCDLSRTRSGWIGLDYEEREGGAE